MKKVGLTVTLLVLATLLLVSNMAPVSAGVCSGTERDDGGAWPELRIWLVINTATQKLEFKWDSPSIILFPIPSQFVEVGWMVWDDKGFANGWVCLLSGSHSYTEDYSNTYTWAYAEAVWVYSTLGSGIPIFFHAKIYVYVDNGNTWTCDFCGAEYSYEPDYCTNCHDSFTRVYIVSCVNGHYQFVPDSPYNVKSPCPSCGVTRFYQVAVYYICNYCGQWYQQWGGCYHSSFTPS